MLLFNSYYARRFIFAYLLLTPLLTYASLWNFQLNCFKCYCVIRNDSQYSQDIIVFLSFFFFVLSSPLAVLRFRRSFKNLNKTCKKCQYCSCKIMAKTANILQIDWIWSVHKWPHYVQNWNRNWYYAQSYPSKHSRSLFSTLKMYGYVLAGRNWNFHFGNPRPETVICQIWAKHQLVCKLLSHC